MLSNGDTPKQLLARNRYLLYKNKLKWSENQIERSYILFELYPDIEKPCELAQDLRIILRKQRIKLLVFQGSLDGMKK